MAHDNHQDGDTTEAIELDVSPIAADLNILCLVQIISSFNRTRILFSIPISPTAMASVNG